MVESNAEAAAAAASVANNVSKAEGGEVEVSVVEAGVMEVQSKLAILNSSLQERTGAHPSPIAQLSGALDAITIR